MCIDYIVIIIHMLLNKKNLLGRIIYVLAATRFPKLAVFCIM